MFLVTAEQMRELDRSTIEEVGIPGAVLMENAGRGAVCALWQRFPGLAESRVAVFCGRGNNGGDGFVISRYLLAQGIEVDIYLVGRVEEISGDARTMLDILRNMRIPVRETGIENGLVPSDIRWETYHLLVDALLGTGLSSDVRGPMGDLIAGINGCDAPVMAVDIPSGLSSDTGKPLGCAVKAHLTVTFGLPKVGQVLFPGREWCGDLWVVDIGIPHQVLQKHALPYRLIDPRDLRCILPSRASSAHKGHFGHLLVIAGSPGKTGAAVMASEAALRAGAGLVTLGIPQGLNPSVEAQTTAVMTIPLPQNAHQTFSEEAVEVILHALEGKACMALGPGIATVPETQEMVRALVRQVPLPMVIDADGLNALAHHLDLLKVSSAPRILTPHPGEMARLLDCSVVEIQEDRIGAALQLTRRTGSYVVLKGAGTVLVDPNEQVRVVPSGNPAMASAGTGDILTGILGGLLAQGVDPMEAMSLGTYLHGSIADDWAERVGERGMIATDLLPQIPQVLSHINRGEFMRAWPKKVRGCPFNA
jgi:NAD(P)H-hydrate epimerase